MARRKTIKPKVSNEVDDDEEEEVDDPDEEGSHSVSCILLMVVDLFQWRDTWKVVCIVHIQDFSLSLMEQWGMYSMHHKLPHQP